MPRHEELTGTFQRERNVFQEDDPERRCIIGDLEDGTTIKGHAQAGELEGGLTYRFLGRWSTHPTWGRQFHFSSFALATPSGERATIKYLARGPGIGLKRAKEIWRRFGEESLAVCREQPGTLAAAIKGITLEAAEAIAEYFQAHVRLERVTIELNDILASRGFPKTLPDRVIREWGERAPAIIRERPYSLMAFRGVGFGIADALYLELGHDPAAIDRQAWCLHHAMSTSGEGHTWWPASHGGRVLRKAVSVDDADLHLAVKYGEEHGLLATRWNTTLTHIALASNARAEERLAGHVYAAIRESQSVPTRWPDLSDCEALSEHQRTEAARATDGFFGILAGSPGTGKTYTLAQIIKTIQQREGAARIAVAAPTGKAAVRASESLASQGVNMVATTIHRLLGVVAQGDGDREMGFSFAHDEDTPLELDYLFVDEASMIDASLAASLLAARPAGCHVLWIGDPDQLAPVGHGAPLRDLIAAGLPRGHLKEIRRNAGRIVRACAEIRDHQRCTFSPDLKLDAEPPENLVLVESDNPDGQIELMEAAIRAANIDGLDPVWDCQIVVPVNDKSPLGRKRLNRHLQQMLNPRGERLDGCPFRVGDKITCTKNGYLPLIQGDPNGSPKEGEAYVANGELARVMQLNPAAMVVQLTMPDRLCRVPRGKAKSEDGEASAGCNFDLAYALSVHKSQGSEWPVVIVMLDGYGGALRVMDRHWVYTAISRAKEYCVCIGAEKTVLSSVRQSHMWRRKTFLRERLDELHLDAALQAFSLPVTEPQEV